MSAAHRNIAKQLFRSGSAKTGFLLTANLIIDGYLDIDRDLERVGESLTSLKARLPRPASPARTNQLTEVSCSDCGRTGHPLRLHLVGGWLCPLCHRELQVKNLVEDEYGRLI